MADYNLWMNDRLYALCTSITDEENKEDKGAFFGSIHGTLNHILYGDLAFMSRFTGNPLAVPELRVDLYSDFQELLVARNSLDLRIAEWALTLEDDWLEQELTYTSKVGNQRLCIGRCARSMSLFRIFDRSDYQKPNYHVLQVVHRLLWLEYRSHIHRPRQDRKAILLSQVP